MDSSQQTELEISEEKGLPRNPHVKFHFQREEFDFFFQWLTGMSTHGGCQIGEAFYVASQIEDGNIESWIREWGAMSKRVLKRADTSLQYGHTVSAREAYLRAYYYSRGPLAFISPLDEPERYMQVYEEAQAIFRKAIDLFNTPVDIVEVPFQGEMMPGYFFKPSDSPTPHKTLILIGGGDTFAEDMYYFLTPAALKRDYNLLTVDLPGQGIMPFKGLVWPHESEKPVAKVVDYALSRSDVDSDRLAIFGLSGGGHLVPRAVTVEKRIKACVACALILDFSAVWNRAFVTLNKRAESSLIYKALKAYFKRKREAYFDMVDTYVWRIGVKSAGDLIEGTQGYTVDPEKITCPFLNIVAQQEFEESSGMMAAAKIAQEKCPHPNNKLIVMPANEGADSHGIGTNLSLLSQVTFDWLDETLA